MRFSTGQEWSYHAPNGSETSRIVIGAIATCDSGNHIICFSVLAAPPETDGGAPVTIAFVPMTETAFAETVVEQTGMAEPPHEFSPALQAWSQDSRGFSVFTVPFEGFLNRMIARQMAAIVGEPAA